MMCSCNVLLACVVTGLMLAGCVSSPAPQLRLAELDTARFEYVYEPCGSVMNWDYGPSMRTDTLAVHRQCLY